MSDEIINFYKKAADTEEPQKPIEEQKETPAPVLPQPDEPFDKFLFELAEKLKNEKVITEKQQETFQEQIKQPVLEEDKNSDDPFKKFIGSFANILKEDELVNREENIKEATISFINKLKEQPEEPFIIKDQPLVKTKKKYLPPKIKQKVEKLPQPIKKEEPVVAEQADEPVIEEPKDENKYVQELKTADKSNKKIPEKIKSVSDIKSIVEKQVAEILSRYPNLGFTGGGGGTNAVQYAKGGTMDGDLNVTGKFLSGGVDISTLFGTGGGAISGIPDRLISGSQSLILNTDGSISFPDNFITAPDGEVLNIQSETVSPSSFSRISLSPYAFFAYDNEGNSISFDVVDNTIELISKNEYSWKFNNQGVLVGPGGVLSVTSLSSLGRILSGGKDLTQIFLTSATDAQTLSWIASSYQLSISNGNLVSLASLSSAGGGTGRDDVNTIVISNSANWNTAYQSVSSQSLNTNNNVQFNQVNANVYLSGGINLFNLLSSSGGGGTGRDDVNTVVIENSANWIDTTTVVQSYSGNWNTAYQNVSSQSLNITDNVYFNEVGVGGINETLIVAGAIKFSGQTLIALDEGALYEPYVGTALNWGSSGYISLYKPFGFQYAPDPAYAAAESRNSLGLGTAAQMSSADFASTTDYQNLSSKYLSLSGGTVTGDVTVTGNLTALGTSTFLNTVFSTTSTLSVINTGPGPALYVFQASGPYDVASFYDGDGIEVLHVGNANPNGLGRVGINESFPNLELTVRGSVSATGTVYASAIDISTAILSGGVNIFNLLTDDQTLSYNETTAALSISNGNSVSLSSINTTFAANSGKYESVYTNVQSNSATWTDTSTTVQNNSANWNNAYNTGTVYQANSGSYATVAFTDSKYLPLSGGTLTDNLSVYGSTYINNNLTIGGNLTALGTATFANTIFTTTSALSVVNTGPGPALYVFQAAGPYDVASFYDGDGIEVLHVGNAGPGGLGKVGVNESFPNQELTVKGSISATETIYANNYLSAGVNLLDIFTGGGGGGGGTAEKRFDYTTVLGIDYSYSGTAIQDTPETSFTWNLVRLTYNNNGTISNQASAINSWTGRLTAAYV